MSRPALPRYRILDRIGAGGMGVVYRAEDLSLGREVALKILPDAHAERADRVSRFRREARAAAALNHPGICTIYEVGEISPGDPAVVSAAGEPLLPGSHYIAMEHIRGRTLHDLIAGRPLALAEALALATEIAEGLAHAHGAGVVHRDLKPGNIMVTADRRTKILDFGLAKFSDAPAAVEGDSQATNLTGKGEILGTSAYMSPEQALAGEVDHRSDLFSFGAVLHEMLTGRPAFPGATWAAILGAVVRNQPAPASSINPAVTAEVEGILARCLQKDPAARYADASGIVRDLRTARARIADSTAPTVAGPALGAGAEVAAEAPTARPAARRARLWAAAAALLAAGVGITALLQYLPPAGAPPERVSLAILPVEVDGPPELVYLRDVIPLALADALNASQVIQVAPFASSRVFGPASEPAAAARQLGVAWIVAGKVTIDGTRFELALRAASAIDARRSWSKEIRGELAQIVPLAAAAAAEIAASAGGNRGGRPAGPGRDPAALSAYLKGVTLAEGWDVERNAEKAAAAFREAIAADPRFAEAHAGLALALTARFSRTRDASVIEEAGEAAARALELAPSLPEASVAEGLVELQRGRSAQAVVALERGLALAPADDALHRHIARAYSDLGRDAEADEMYRRAVELRPALWANYNAWANHCFRRGHYDKAFELFGKVVELHPESDSGYTNLAAAYIMQGRHREAEPLLQAALRINPSVQSRNNLGTVYYALGKYDEAAREWETAASISDDAMIHSNLGDARRQQHRAEEARRAYEAALEMGRARLAVNPSDAATRGIVANALAGLGRCAEAAREGERAVSESRNDPAIAYYAAVASAICRDTPAAVRCTLLAIDGGAVADVKSNPDLAPVRANPEVARKLAAGPRG